MSSGIDAKAFRRAVRKERFGDDDVERVYPTPAANSSNPTAIEQFKSEIETRLEPPNKSVEIRQAESPFSALYIISEFEKAAEDFGAEAEIVTNESIHSYVDQSNGQVYLPKLIGTGAALEYGARCNVNDPGSYSHALHQKGTMLPFMGNARILLELGVNIDEGDVWGETALMHACFSLNEKTIRWLLSKGADPRKSTVGSQATALHRAVEAQGSDLTKAEIAKLLIQQKADPNAQNAWGVTPLHIAAVQRLPETCKALLSFGASPKIQDWRGKLPVAFSSASELDSTSKKKDADQVSALLQV